MWSDFRHFIIAAYIASLPYRPKLAYTVSAYTLSSVTVCLNQPSGSTFETYIVLKSYKIKRPK